MWLFEVTDSMRPGVRLVLTPGRMGIPLGVDEQFGTPITLPVGKSISRVLDHPDDQAERFVLRRGILQPTAAGFILVKQTEEEAMAEGKALVFVDRCTDDELGHTRVCDAWSRSSPKLLYGSNGQGYRRELYEFKQGDALFICWPAAALDQLHPKRFIISWDGQQLTEELCRRHPKRRRARRLQKASATEQEPLAQTSPQQVKQQVQQLSL